MSDTQPSNTVLPSHSQEDVPYVNAVRAYASKDFLRLDVPGHTGSAVTQPELADMFGESVLALDVPPLVDGIDQGPFPTPMQRSAQLAAEAWGAHRTWLLTNGASKGNLVTCLALRHVGELIVAQRSMHSSVMDGMVLGGLQCHFVQPVIDVELGAAHGITPASLAEALDTFPGAVAVYVVSPSYFGAESDIQALADVAHSRACALIVDGAWGSHFGFHPDLPQNALAKGADVMISSTHKLGGSLTQSAMLHLGNGPYVDLLEPLLLDAVAKHQVAPGQLTLHADRGGPMKAKATAFLLADLGVTRSHNRPHTSNDNPFSESHFKTLKYQPRFPRRFGCIEDAKAFCRQFFDWYNQDHHHAGIGLMTPDQVHYGQVDAIHAARQNTLDRACRDHPERFVNQPPKPPAKPTAACINPPSRTADPQA